MGRFYSGDIEGKFAFYQASDDASFFHIKGCYEPIYFYPCCSSEIRGKGCSQFCDFCKNPAEVEESTANIYYEFTASDSQMQEMQERLTECFDAINISKEMRAELMHKEGEEKNAYYNRIDEMVQQTYLYGEADDIIACRLVLGLRINHCLHIEGSCEFLCEC